MFLRKKNTAVGFAGCPFDMKKQLIHQLISLLILVSLSYFANGQSSVAITIDDVPNTSNYQMGSFKSILLNKLDSLKIPITIFINGGNVFRNDSVEKNFSLLNQWIKRDYITLGNHTYSHSRYSSVGIDSFKIDVGKGENNLHELALKHRKSLKYFRFPYNDLGKDSIQHQDMEKYLSSRNYTIAPYTVESSDWMISYIYNYYLEKKDTLKANEIAESYILKTIEYFDFFDSLALKIYGRRIKQVYLCHDNILNGNYLPKLINELKKKRYTFISLDEALQDDVYKQEDKYYKPWGVSWLYRWMNTREEITSFQKHEPKDDLYDLYLQLSNQNKK
ncbi:MAG: polysaccharide deacetylase family protein [Bacteroidota bacterium]